MATVKAKKSEEFRFRRFELNGARSLAAMMESHRSGIYILEFANGERYVGQSVDLRQRFAQHVHGSGHEPWNDIVACAFVDVQPEDLNWAEALMIENQLGEGKKLRNRQMNFNYDGPCGLDAVISVKAQRHWACGDWHLDLESFAWGAERPLQGQPKLLTDKQAQEPNKGLVNEETLEPATVADSVLMDLGAVLSAIPDAVNLEKRYWTVTDCPTTAGGRFATLNVGCLEVYFCGRHKEPFEVEEYGEQMIPEATLNLAPGSILEGTGDDLSIKKSWDYLFDRFPIACTRYEYKLTATDALCFPVGTATWLLEEPLVREAVQTLCLKLMRKGETGLFRRFHSEDIATLAYEQTVNLYADEDEVA